MNKIPDEHRVHDPIAKNLTPADDRILLSDLPPPQAGIVPQIRLGKRWIDVLWALPILFVLLISCFAVARSLRQLRSVQTFLGRYSGAPASMAAVTSGLPLRLRVQHFLYLFFMAFSRALARQIIDPRGEAARLSLY